MTAERRVPDEQPIELRLADYICPECRHHSHITHWARCSIVAAPSAPVREWSEPPIGDDWTPEAHDAYVQRNDDLIRDHEEAIGGVRPKEINPVQRRAFDAGYRAGLSAQAAPAADDRCQICGAPTPCHCDEPDGAL